MAKKTVEESVIDEEKELILHVYEVGYLMLPTIAEEGLGGEVTSFKDIITLDV